MAKTKTSVVRNWIVYFPLISLSCTVATAQKIESISVALQTESIAIPFTRLTPVHPGIEIGVSFNEKVKPNSARKWNAYVGWFYHKRLDQNIYIRGEYQFAYTIKDVVSLSIPVGLGYMHSFLAQPVYEQNSDGSFNEKTQLGRPHALINVGFGISYLKLGPIEPFLKYEAMIQAPFASTIPILPRDFLKIGSTFKF